MIKGVTEQNCSKNIENQRRRKMPTVLSGPPSPAEALAKVGGLRASAYKSAGFESKQFKSLQIDDLQAWLIRVVQIDIC